jgi:SpoVK/Ycf46/Vps4 family AAA+-type ATPase
VARRTFQDVILPPRTRRMLDEALTQVHSYALIFEEWGLGERHPTGTALAFNFAGPSGTGKTICAEAIAHHLGKRLLLVRYAELESMWFGETPKNVAAIFRMAHEEDAVLFFDEADAVAARRSRDVSQGMQRESNTTVNVMLQELERFDGVVIFATNLAANFDPAFERRIRTHVLFELPGVEEREQIWQVQLHQRTPLAADVNFRELAERYAVSGGDIRNAVLKAALSAAAEDGPDELKRISQRHFIGAMDEVVLAKTVMRQSLIESPDRQYETALTETRHMLDQMRTAGAVAAAAAGAALLLALIALVVALL